MKWIGQHIYDLVSRFRDDVYLENISTGTIASGGNLGLDSNNKIVKATETTGDITGVALTATTGIDLTSVSGATGGDYAATIGVDVSDFLSSGSSGRVVTSTGADAMQGETYLTFTNALNVSTLTLFSDQDTGDLFRMQTTTHGATTLTTIDDDSTAAHFEIAADGDITLDAAGDVKIEAGGDDLTLDADKFTFTSATSQKPLIEINDTTNDADGSRLIFQKNRGAAGQDSDLITALQFKSYNDAGTPELINYAQILPNITDATDGQESGSLTFQVASHGGGNETGLVIKGGSQDDEVDVDIALGTASVTTVAGDLTVTGSDLTFDSVALTAVQTSGESFADNDTSIMTSAAIDDRINAADTTTHATVQTGKHYRIVNTSFRADIGTDKYYLPLKSQDEQTVLTREENQEVAVCDGRLVSLTWRAEAFNTHTGDATVTFGVETNTVGSSYSGGYSVIETESVTVNHADDQHLWHVVFDTAKHWDSTDMFTISMQSDTDITGSNERIFITLVIEDDWSTYLAGSTREIDTTP
jgi:hypothetical protein